MSKFQVHNNLLYNTRTGNATTLWSDEKTKRFVAAIRAGHCGNGYYIPILMIVNAPNKELAVEVTNNLSRIKNVKNNILAIDEISELEYFFLDYINDCDPYLKFLGKTNLSEEISERRVVSEEIIKDDVLHPSKNVPFQVKDKYEVKTADEYEQKYVLQRHFAPRFIGDKLVFPKKVKIRDFLDEYFREQTRELGIKYKKATMLSYYYQMYGPNNDLGIVYNDGVITFNDENGDEFVYELKDSIIEHLEKAKEYWDNQSYQEDKTQEYETKLKSARDRFNDRLAKTQAINPPDETSR